MRRVVLTLAVVLALVIPTAASARVHLVSRTSPVEAGAYARLTVTVTPARVCSISVYDTTVVSKAKGLNQKRPQGGIVSWTWLVGTSTNPGWHSIVVSCGSAGSLHTSFLVM